MKKYFLLIFLLVAFQPLYVQKNNALWILQSENKETWPFQAKQFLLTEKIKNIKMSFFGNMDRNLTFAASKNWELQTQSCVSCKASPSIFKRETT